MKLKMIFSSIFLTLLSCVVAHEESLKLVHIIYRHGARTPVDFYKNDQYQGDVFWPQGLGQLTKEGKAMEYKLGGWLRNRYDTFVKKTFDPEEFHVVSTDYDRTLMSAQCVLASFFYPDDDVRFNKSIPWMPVPIHTAPSGADMIINVDSTCPRVSHEMEEMHRLPEIISYVEQRKAFFNRMTQNAGDDRSTIRQVADLYDTLFIEKHNNLSIPEWAVKDFDEMREVSVFSFKINSFTRELKRLRGGPLIREVTNNMDKYHSGKLSHRNKLFMYSAHDSTIAIVLNSLGVYNERNPPYASTILFELHSINGSPFVKLFYRNDTTMERPAYPLAIPGCDEVCPLSKWKSLLSDVIPEDWKKECDIPDPIAQEKLLSTLTGLLVAATLLLLILGTCLFIERRKSKDNAVYHLLSDPN